MVKTGSVRFFKPGENQSVSGLERELINLFVLNHVITSTDEICFEPDSKNATTVVYIKYPERVKFTQRLDLAKQLQKIATNYQKDSIYLAHIPLEVIIQARLSPPLLN